MGASELTRIRHAAGAESYEAYYGFVEAPFSLAPGVRFAYQSRAHAAALDEIRRALERREGLIVVSGEVGTGKTMICRALSQDGDFHVFVSYVTDPCLSAEEMLTHILRDFGVLDDDRMVPGALPIPRHQLSILLHRFLVSLLPLGARAVVVIDEAQHLHPAVLEQIRLWSDLELQDTKLLQIVLAGQHELDETLARPELRQVLQRVSRRCELTPLRRDEVGEYLEHRLTVARAPADGRAARTPAGMRSQPDVLRVRFTPSAVRTVADISRGVPRVVNLLADRALEVGHERHTRDINSAIVTAAARRLKLIAPRVPRRATKPLTTIGDSSPGERKHANWLPGLLSGSTSRRQIAAAAAAILMLAVLPWLWQGRRETAVAAGPVTSASMGTVATPAATETTADASATATASRSLVVQDSVDVTIASFRSSSRAEAVAARLVGAGFPAFTRRDAGGVWHQVIVGPFVSADEAVAAQRALVAEGVAGTEVRLESIVASDRRPN
jgi:type II secretory pathway predicted ATPase ExeA